MVTVGYEYATGKRTTGQTQTAGFEIGVQKTIAASQKWAWDLIISQKGLKIWLGDVAKLKFKKGEKFTTKEGTQWEIRTIDPGTKIRLIWHPNFLKKPSTIQLYLLCHRNRPQKTNVRFHQEKLSDIKEREKMRKHWQNVLNKLGELVVSR